VREGPRTLRPTDTRSTARLRQKKTGRRVKFELTEQTRQAVEDYVRVSGKKSGEFLFTSRRRADRCMTTRRYARLVAEWIGSIRPEACCAAGFRSGQRQLGVTSRNPHHGHMPLCLLISVSVRHASRVLLDHLVGACEQHRRHFKTKKIGCLGVDH
jgi:integrase